MLTHNVASFAGGLSAKLARDHGTSAPSSEPGHPSVAVCPTHAFDPKDLGRPERRATRLIQTNYLGRNLEEALSRLRRIQAVVEGGDVVDGLTKTQAGSLDLEICRLIIQGTCFCRDPHATR